MKIGIMTFHWATNYGAVLQAYALQTFLSAREHDAQIVDYRVESPQLWYRKWLSKTLRDCLWKWELAYKKYLFKDFCKEYLICTPEIFHTIEDMGIISNRFDVLIAGSDQVWNPRWLSQDDGLFDSYFLSFAGDRTLRISYAASFGHSEMMTIKDEWQKIIREKLRDMHVISVRESSSIDLVYSLCGRDDVVQVIDPTLLLRHEYYEKLVGSSQKRRKILFSYMLHGLESDSETVSHHICEMLNLKLLKCDACKTSLRNGYILPSPIDWLRRIQDASFVVTNSFHGVVFCLLFHTPFVAIMINGQLESMNCRIIELLTSVGLNNRIVSSPEQITVGICADKIEWDKVDRKIDILRAESIEFLSKQGL